MDEKERAFHYGIVNFERRKHPRFNIDLPIEYSILPSSTSHLGRALNVSEGGLLIYLSERVEINQLVQLRLFFPSGSELNKIELVAEVVWKDIHLGKEWGDYRCGVRFIDISAEDLGKLKRFLRSLLE
ncbi:MAG: PilZ domain-containing protein [Thermodesulfobacteriota bacterium]